MDSQTPSISNLSKWQRIRLHTLIDICHANAAGASDGVMTFPHGSLEMGYVGKAFETVAEAAAAAGWRLDVSGDESGSGIRVAVAHRAAAGLAAFVSTTDLAVMRAALIEAAAADGADVLDYDAIATSFTRASAEMWGGILGLVPKSAPVFGGGGGAGGMMMMGGDDGDGGAALKFQLMMMQQQMATGATQVPEEHQRLMERLRGVRCVVEASDGPPIVPSAAMRYVEAEPLIVVTVGSEHSLLKSEADRFLGLVLQLSAVIPAVFCRICGATADDSVAFGRDNALLFLAATIAAQRRIKEQGIRLKFPLSAIDQALLSLRADQTISGVYNLGESVNRFTALRSAIEYSADAATTSYNAEFAHAVLSLISM